MGADGNVLSVRYNEASMRRFMRKRALTAVALMLALLALTLWSGVPRAAASSTPTITITGYPGPGDGVVIGGGNWPYGDTISVTFDGAQLATTVARFRPAIAEPVGGASAGASFKVGVQIPLNTTVGPHTIAATDSSTNDTAQMAITVTAEWKQFGFSSANTRYNPYETAIGAGNVAQLTPAWTYQSTGSQCTVPTIVMPSVAQGNVVFFNQEYCQLVSLNATTGAVNWTAVNSYLSARTQPAIADGVIFDEAGYLLASSASTGVSLWQSPYQRYQVSPVVANGMVYVTGHWNFEVSGYSLEAYPASGCGQSTCAPVWSYPLTGGSEITTAVANGSVYFGNAGATESYILAVDAETGALQWSGAVTGDQEIHATAVDNGYVIFTADIPQGYPGAPGGTLYVFDAAGCGQALCQPLWTATNAAGWGASTAIANGVIYVGGLDNALYAFNELGCGQATCSPLWQSASLSQTASYSVAAPAVANDVVYYTSGATGEALAYDAKGCKATTCSPLWTYPLGLGSSVSSTAPPVIVNGMLYVSDSNNVLYAFRLPATTAQRSDASPSQTTSTPATPQLGPSQSSRFPSPSSRFQAIWAFRLSRYQGS
jgi:putative pyrroloquinoline-quinone binding quinoprotein